MYRFTVPLCLLVILLLVGCKTRPISNSGYHHNFRYHGELSELAVLGIDFRKQIDESDIQKALDQAGEIKLNRSDKILLIQSGTQFPDDAFMQEMGRYYDVIPVNGIPDRNLPGVRSESTETDSSQPPLDKAIRLTAARAGATTVIVYWGVLESSRKGYATKTMSWVPIVGSVIPDENQQMRICLKAAVIDVSSGYWEMLIPEVYEDEETSNKLNREQSDQYQVQLLKEKGYKRLVADIRTRYG